MISVIVPVYKVEKYLRRCVDSILKQTCRDFELLLIDDGSPDGCPQICDEYAALDSRVLAFHKPNGGLSDARKYGLDLCRGDYISFIDSDDYVGPDYLKILVELAEQYDVRLAAVAHECVFSDEMSFIPSEDTRALIPNDEILKTMARGKLIFSAWGKLIRRDLLAESRFPVGYLFEDNLLMPYLMCECNAVACSASRQYYWLKRPDSIMGTISEKKVYDWEMGIDRLLEFTKKNYPRDMEYMEGWVADIIWHISIDQLIFTERYPEHARRIREKYGPILKKSWSLPVVSRGRKLKSTIFLLSPSCYRAMRKGWHAVMKK
ncbi:MAG: glycosyltransferase family 2 protein [Clostridia bacterium]|nr:glycosyltransferase family 2 protein [Clostridia bacterium]